MNSLGNATEDLTLVWFIDLEVLTKLFNSVNLSDDAFNCLNNEYIVVPLTLHAQQCQGFLPSLFSVKFTSYLGLWWWQKGQWYA